MSDCNDTARDLFRRDQFSDRIFSTNDVVPHQSRAWILKAVDESNNLEGALLFDDVDDDLRVPGGTDDHNVAVQV
jgi:hypothetical protein